MRLNAYLQFGIDFARFCAESGHSPYHAAQVIAAARRCFAIGARACNEEGHDSALATARAELRKLEPRATFAGGLWPAIDVDNGHEIRIPSWD